MNLDREKYADPLRTEKRISTRGNRSAAYDMARKVAGYFSVVILDMRAGDHMVPIDILDNKGDNYVRDSFYEEDEHSIQPPADQGWTELSDIKAKQRDKGNL